LQIGGTQEFKISDYWTFTSNMAECPIERFELWTQVDGVWGTYNDQSYLTLKSVSDPDNVAVEVNKANAFPMETVAIFAFTSSNKKNSINLNVVVCGGETITILSDYSHDNPLIAVG
jgi:hypothetical protein